MTKGDDDSGSISPLLALCTASSLDLAVESLALSAWFDASLLVASNSLRASSLNSRNSLASRAS